MSPAPRSGSRHASHGSRRRRLRRWRRRWRRTRRWLRPVLLFSGVAVGLVLIVTAIGVVHAIRLEHRLQSLNAELQQVQNDAEDGRLGVARTELAAVQTNLTSINATLYDSKDFSVLGVVPVARQNLQVVRGAVSVALQLVTDGQQILAAGAPLEGPNGHLDVSLKDGQIPLAAVQGIQSTLDTVLENFPVATQAPGGTFVLGRVRAAAQRVYTEAAKRHQELSSVDQGLTLLNAIAGGGGQSRFLIAVVNSAEMRGSGGMILSYGVLDASGGKVTLGKFGPIDDLQLAHPVTGVSFPADFTRTYGALQPTLLWRNANIMSDFTVDAPVLEAMYTQATGLPVNGVFQIDPAGLSAILAATGPVTVPGLGVVTAQNVVAQTLNQAYVQFPDRPVRQEFLTSVARQAFAALTSGSLPSLRVLGTALVQEAKERHIILDFKDPTVQSTVATLGFDGSLPPPGQDFAQVTSQNFGGDKMDFYVDSALAIQRSKGSRSIVATVDITNTAPAGGRPPYIFGPETDHSDPPGTYRGLVTLYLPQYTYVAGSTPDAAATAPFATTQNGVVAVSYAVDLAPGGHSTVTIRATLPPGRLLDSRFVFVPTPRVNPTKFTLSG